MKLRLLFIFLISCFGAHASSGVSASHPQTQIILVYTNGSDYWKDCAALLDQFHVDYALVDQVDPDAQSLHLIFDAYTIPGQNLPQYYIAFQTQDLTALPLDTHYMHTLTRAVAVWDYSKENINTYNTWLYHYYYMPKGYEHAGMVVQPLFLSLSALDAYKDLLVCSNRDNTDVSSLISALF